MESDELNTDKDAVNLAQQLLQELPQNDPDTKILANWILLAKDTKDSINEAIAGFHKLDTVNPDGSLTGVCAGLVLQKKNQAKGFKYTVKILKSLRSQ